MPTNEEANPLATKNMPTTSTRWHGIAKLILGSKSWSRRTLLSELKVPPFSLVIPDIDESKIRIEDARELVLAIGNAKAVALLDRNAVEPAPAASGKTLLVCGDSVVKHKDRILEKPVDMAEARAFLKSYASAPATTVSSIIVVDVVARKKWEGVDEGEVYFREMPDDVIEELVTKGGAMESAGGLRIEHPLAVQYTECMIGYRSAVMGFSQPLAEELLLRALTGEGGEDVA